MPDDPASIPTPRHRPVVFCVLDGWGWREDPAHNAVLQARTPHVDHLWQTCPRALLRACGEDVGLPEGQIGNSEVGHMNLGAGRVVLQDLLNITKALRADHLAESPAMRRHIARLKDSGGTCHLIGLVSPGGVHAHQDHMVALAHHVADAGVPVAVHVITDGRDTAPRGGLDFVGRFVRDLGDRADVRVATVSGRYYAMDRDTRWERVKRAYDAMVDGDGPVHDTADAVIRTAYGAEQGDEFIVPSVLEGYAGMADGDGVLFANFRADRARQILEALLDPAFAGFERTPKRFADACGLVEYSDRLNGVMSAIFPPKSLDRVLGQVVSEAGLTQLRMAETEKYPHVTYFFNGGEETRFPGEERIMVPSPKVATYDLQPEMSAPEVGAKLVEAIDSGRFDLIVVNFANPDMVGHTGDLAAAITACETVDACVGDLVAAVRRAGGVLLLTADHGNCEMMRDPDSGQPHTAHTLNPVPVMLVNGPAEVTRLVDGRLADVAPTLLALLGLDPPAEMTGRCLIPGGARRRAAE